MNESIEYSFWFNCGDHTFLLTLINLGVVLYWQDPSDGDLVSIHKDIYLNVGDARNSYLCDLESYFNGSSVPLQYLDDLALL